MKKLFFMLMLSAAAFASCDKTDNDTDDNTDYIFYAKLTSNKGDWEANETSIGKDFIQAEFTNGQTIVRAKSTSTYGVEYCANTVWPGAWKQSLEVYFDSAWAEGSHFNFVTNPTGSDGNFPKCNQVLTFANDASTATDYLYFSQNTQIATNVISKGTAMASKLSGWYTFEFDYYYDDTNDYYTCDARVLDASANIVLEYTYGQVNKDGLGLGGQCIVYFDGWQSTYDATTNTHPDIVIRNQKVELLETTEE